MRLKTPSQAVGKVLAANQKWRCGHCDKLLEATYQIDHRKPLCHGGTNSIDNLWILCASCHALKSLAEQQSMTTVPVYGKTKKRRRYTQHVSIALIECPFYQTFFTDGKEKEKEKQRAEEKEEKEEKEDIKSTRPITDRTERYEQRAKEKSIDTKHAFTDFVVGNQVELWNDSKWEDGEIMKCVARTQQVIVRHGLKTKRCAPSHVRLKI
jgi:hypothetical protein